MIFNRQFKRVSRPERERILCAMIRVNYGTPWAGDLQRLRSFFPDSFHPHLVFGGLAELIEMLSPFADEPTELGLSDSDEITLHDSTSLNSGRHEATSTLTQALSDSTLTQASKSS